MDEFVQPNAISITITSEGYAINTCISNKVSDKTFQQMLSRATYAERYIRASFVLPDQEMLLAEELTEDEE
jgi:hypothetical protein